MKIWIICTGEREGVWPGRCDAAGFEAAARRAAEEPPEDRGEKKISGQGRKVWYAPVPAARRTAELCVEGGELLEEPLLAPVALRAGDAGGSHSTRFWLTRAALQRRLGGRAQPESRKAIRARAEELLRRLEEEEKDCVLVADALLVTELLDRARAHGYDLSRTGIFRYRPWERVLLTRRDQHCGGCRHNCLLSDPGCGVGRDKAARQARKTAHHPEG